MLRQRHRDYQSVHSSEGRSLYAKSSSKGSAYDAKSSIGGVSELDGTIDDGKVVPIGDVACDWIKVIGAAPPRKGSAAPVEKPVTLPSELVPAIKWEAIPHSRAGTAPVGRQGHVILRVGGRAGSSDYFDVFQVAGGCADFPLRVPVPAPDPSSRKIKKPLDTKDAKEQLSQLVNHGLRRRFDLGPTAFRLREAIPFVGRKVSVVVQTEFKAQAKLASPLQAQTLGTPKQGAVNAIRKSARSTAEYKVEKEREKKEEEPADCVSGPTGLSAEWHTPPTDLPRRLVSCSACILSGGTRVAIFGGIEVQPDGGRVLSRECHVLEVLQNTWRDESAVPDGPPPCCEQAFAAAEGGREMIVHGGLDTLDDGRLQPMAKAWTLSVNDRSVKWTPMKPTSYLAQFEEYADAHKTLARPPPRRAHSLTIEGGQIGRGYMFGGIDDYGNVVADLRVLDLERRIWLTVESVGAPPIPRAYHAGAQAGPYMAIFGGVGASGAMIKEFRLLHCHTFIWSAPKFLELTGEPSARAAHSLNPIYLDTHREGVYSFLVFGGRATSGESLNDMHRVVLTLPPQTRSGLINTDVGFRYASEELHLQIEQRLREHAETMNDRKVLCAELMQDIRNTVTNKLAAEIEVRKHERSMEEVQQIVDELGRALEAKEKVWDENEQVMKDKLRELQINTESTLARVKRLEMDRDQLDGSLALRSQVQLGHQLDVVPNHRCPQGCVQRQRCNWLGAHIAAECIEAFHPFSSSRPLSTNPLSQAFFPGARPSQSATVALIEASHSQNVTSRTRPGALDKAKTNKQWEVWIDAVRRELKIMLTIIHPNLQSVYGAVADQLGIVLLVQVGSVTLCKAMKETSEAVVLAIEGDFVPTPQWESSIVLSEKDALHFSCDLATGLEYLHCKGVAHRYIVEENVLIKISEGMSNRALLAGHFAARVVCRASGEHFVQAPEKSQTWGFPPSALLLLPSSKSMCQCHEDSLNLVDARRTDVYAFGFLLFRLWHLCSAAAAPCWLRERRNIDKAYAAKLREEAAEALAESGEPGPPAEVEAAQDLAEALADIRDNSVRFVVHRCLGVERHDEQFVSVPIPSAREVKLAWDALPLSDLDLTTWPQIATEDPSRTSLLADVAALCEEDNGVPVSGSGD